jgi:hypothetical protein
VVWFLRNGVLYRRLLLIRNPYAKPSGVATDQPQDANLQDMILGNYGTGNLPWDSSNPQNNTWQDAPGRFWYDFDYSAYHAPASKGGNGLRFHSVQTSLANVNPSTGSVNLFYDPSPTPPDPLVAFNIPLSLGVPCLRYGNSTRRAMEQFTSPGFNRTVMAIPPKEYLTPGDASTFIGRYTVQETADGDFTYPHINPGGSNDPFLANTQVGGNPLSLGADGLVSQYANGLGRRGEDIVMTNVHSFDIKVWDDGLSNPGFVDLNNGGGGYYGTLGGTFTQANGGNRYDTWHPGDDMPAPPYRPVGSTYDDDNDTIADPDVYGSRNQLPLKAILIHIRFYDPGSEQMRDLTFTYSLIDQT